MSGKSSIVYLLEVGSGEGVEAELAEPIEEVHLRDWESKWMPALWKAVERLSQSGVARSRWPQSRHWNWRQKMSSIRGLLALPTFCIVCRGVTQGLMIVDLTRSSRLDEQKGKPLVYIHYLENAPWNRPELQDPPTYRGVGTLLIAAAIQLSLDEGFTGRLGLHSLPQANAFYANTCGMSDLGPDPSYQNLSYFEMTGEQAQAFIERGRKQ